ncbi:MAG: hypothetical protein ACTHJ0_13140, partial [Flavipsychrobacter sp.]
MLEKECDEVLRIMFKHRIKGDGHEIQKYLIEEGINIPNEHVHKAIAILIVDELLEYQYAMDENGKINKTVVSITLKGIAFTETNTYVNKKRISDLDIQIKDQQIILNNSIKQTNDLTRLTNIYVAVFTGIAGEYYIGELLRNYMPINMPHRTFIIYVLLLASLVVGIIGYLRIRRV